MNDEIGLDEDIEPTADASEGVKGGVGAVSPTIAPRETLAQAEANAKLAEKTSPPLGGTATISVDPLSSKSSA